MSTNRELYDMLGEVVALEDAYDAANARRVAERDSGGLTAETRAAYDDAAKALSDARAFWRQIGAYVKPADSESVQITPGTVTGSADPIEPGVNV